MKDGGPAFPRTGNDYQAGDNHKYHPGHEGMSLRDWFAGQALAGVMANPETPGALVTLVNNDNDDEPLADVEGEFLAAIAFQAADAMLKARGKSND